MSQVAFELGEENKAEMRCQNAETLNCFCDTDALTGWKSLVTPAKKTSIFK